MHLFGGDTKKKIFFYLGGGWMHYFLIFFLHIPLYHLLALTTCTAFETVFHKVNEKCGHCLPMFRRMAKMSHVVASTLHTEAHFIVLLLGLTFSI